MWLSERTKAVVQHLLVLSLSLLTLLSLLFVFHFPLISQERLRVFSKHKVDTENSNAYLVVEFIINCIPVMMMISQ